MGGQIDCTVKCQWESINSNDTSPTIELSVAPPSTVVHSSAKHSVTSGQSAAVITHYILYCMHAVQDPTKEWTQIFTQPGLYARAESWYLCVYMCLYVSLSVCLCVPSTRYPLDTQYKICFIPYSTTPSIKKKTSKKKPKASKMGRGGV